MRNLAIYPLWLFKIILASLLALSVEIAFAAQESSIFTYDGQDFIRTQTSLVTEDGKSAVNTKLNRDDPSYKALIQKRSYTGEAALYGQKYELDIRLTKKVDERELKEIANELRRERKQYKRLWIFYYLPGMETGAGAWATTHFTPDLEISILGLTSEEEKKLTKDALNQSRDTIGIWMDDRPYVGSTITLYRENGKLFLKIKYKDGSGSNDEMTESSDAIGTKLVEKGGNVHGEYFVLDKKGNLHAGGEGGLFLKYKKLQ